MGHSLIHTPVHTADKNKHSQCHVVLRVMINSTTNGGRHRNICRITSHSKILTKKDPDMKMVSKYKTISVETKRW